MLLNLAVSVFFFCATALFADSPNEHFDQLVKRGGGFVADTTAEEGTFMLSVAAVALESKVQNPNQLLEMARLIAQRDLSGVLETEIDAKEKLDSRLTTITVSDKQKLAVKEFFTSVIIVKIEVALRGAEILEARSFAGQLYVGFLLSEKRIKVAGKLGGAVVRDDMVSGVVALGLAMVDKSDEAEARARALANAKRNAVEQAFGAVVQSASQLRDYDPRQIKARVFTASFGSVTQHKVFFEKRDGIVYKVKIVAKVSRKIPLEKIVRTWQSSGASFWIDPGKNRENPDQDLFEVFSEFFGELGFRLTDRKQEADYHIALDARPVDRKNPFNGQPLTQMRMAVVIKDPKAEVQILRLKNDERRSTSMLHNPIDRKLDCARKACKQMAPELQKRIGKLVMDQLQNGREIRVVFSEPKNLNGEGYDSVLNLITWMPGVQNCNKTVVPNVREVRYTLRYRGDLNLLQTTLTSEMMKHYPNFYPVLKTMSANEIVFKVPPAEAWGMNLDAKNTRVLARMALAAVVRINVFMDGKPVAMGSGFLIGPNLIASNYHVIDKGNQYNVKLIGREKVYRVTKILAMDTVNDVALMRVEKGIEAQPLELGSSAQVEVGDKVFSVGNPAGLDGTFAQGIISAIRDNVSVKNSPHRIRVFQYTAPTTRGSSGGPIINDRGQVIAVHKWGLNAQLANAGAPVDSLKNLLKTIDQ